jgi:hypothetical protein
MKKIIIGFATLCSVTVFANVKYDCNIEKGSKTSSGFITIDSSEKVIIAKDGDAASIGSSFIVIESDLITAMVVNDPKLQVKLTVRDLLASVPNPSKPGSSFSGDAQTVTMLNAHTNGRVDQKVLITGFDYQRDDESLTNFIKVVCTKI